MSQQNSDPPPPDQGGFFSWRFEVHRSFDVMLLLGLAGCWTGCLARWHWFLALFDHFRLQGAVLSVFVLVLYVVRRRWWLVGAAVLTLAVNVWPLWQTNGVPVPGAAAGGQTGVKIISFNVLTENRRYADTLAWLKTADADVILLLEVSPDWEQALAPLRKSHPHGVTRPREDNFGIALFSRLPLAGCDVSSWVDDGMPTVSALVQAGEKRFRFIGVHPLPPMGRKAEKTIQAQMKSVADFVRQHPGEPCVVAGDFNATPWSAAVQTLRRECPLDFRTPKPAWRPTWQARSLFALPIDQALCTPPLFFASREIGPDLGSDHRAQALVLGWGAPD